MTASGFGGNLARPDMRDATNRIRREDSLWALLDDGWDWRGAQDAKISHRPDPWNIYEQVFPDEQ